MGRSKKKVKYDDFDNLRQRSKFIVNMLLLLGNAGFSELVNAIQLFLKCPRIYFPCSGVVVRVGLYPIRVSNGEWRGSSHENCFCSGFRKQSYLGLEITLLTNNLPRIRNHSINQ